MGDVILAGLLTWLMICVWWGTEFAFRPGSRGKVIGGLLIALGLVPCLVALQLGT